jgi:glycosyltransferase involved in cell wall biosynthesis
MIKIAYYTQPYYLDHNLSRIQHLSKLVDLHVILEVSPEGEKRSVFDVSIKHLPGGIIDAKTALNPFFPASFHSYWEQCSSFKLAVHHCKRSIHPETWTLSRQALEYINNLNPDIFHQDDVSLRLALSLHRLKKKIPMALSIHDPITHSGERNWRMRLARLLTFKRCKLFILHNMALIPAFCNRYGLNPSTVKKLPLGIIDVYQHFEKANIIENPKTILFIGRLSPYKGIDVLIKAATIATKKFADLTFIIAGNPVPGYQIPRLPKLPNNGEFRLITRHISNVELAGLFQKSSLVVCPYLDSSQSGVLLTAYGFNKPVIASRTGGFPEYMEHNKTGLLVNPGDANQLANAIVGLLTDHDKRESIKKEMQKYSSEDLNWGVIARKTLNTYKTILS